MAKKLSKGQERFLNQLKGSTVSSIYDNGNALIRHGNVYYELNRQGEIVEEWGGGKQPKALAKPMQWGLGWEGYEELRPVTQPSRYKKPKYEPKYPYKPTPLKTICQEKPACCQPREIKAVFWDADHTIWDLQGTAASVTGKLHKIDDNTVVELTRGKTYTEPEFQLTPTEAELLEELSEEERNYLVEQMKTDSSRISGRPEESESVRTTIRLDPTFRQTLDELENRGITSSVISLNSPGSVSRILKEFGLEKRFVEIRDSYENKGRVFKELTTKQDICPCDGLFVDDSRSNTEPVSKECGLAIQIGKEKDIEQTIDALKYIKESK